jgi:hypothetical protein
MPTVGGRKISLPLFVFAACVLGIGFGLFGFNIWHTTNCSGNASQEDVEEHIAALNRRLLESESKVSHS